MNRLDICGFIARNKGHIGFGNYEAKVEFKNKGDDCHASVVVSEVGQQLEFTFYKSFENMDDDRQINIILHELIHGRERLQQDRLKDEFDRQEELKVNDVTNLAKEWE